MAPQALGSGSGSSSGGSSQPAFIYRQRPAGPTGILPHPSSINPISALPCCCRRPGPSLTVVLPPLPRQHQRWQEMIQIDARYRQYLEREGALPGGGGEVQIRRAAGRGTARPAACCQEACEERACTGRPGVALRTRAEANLRTGSFNCQ